MPNKVNWSSFIFCLLFAEHPVAYKIQTLFLPSGNLIECCSKNCRKSTLSFFHNASILLKMISLWMKQAQIATALYWYLCYKKGASSIFFLKNPRIEGDTVSNFHSCFENPQNCKIRFMPDKLCHISSKIFAQYWLFIRTSQKLQTVNFILDFCPEPSQVYNFLDLSFYI